jgi:predicted dehydrogenase
MDKRKIRLAQIAYRSEWALAKFFESLKNQDISEKFELKSVCGVEVDVKDAIGSLRQGIGIRLNILKGLASQENGFRFGNRLDEIVNCVELITLLGEGVIKYFQVNGNHSLPQGIYDLGIDAVVVHSLNPTHFGYIEDAVLHGKHVLCEKPLVPVLDRRGKPDPSQIKDLAALVQITKPSIVMMDAEHYSYKRPSLIFYENIDEIIGPKKIKRVEGAIKETDNPYFWRTQDILSLANETGILGDTMCHLLAFISNLGGKARPKQRKFDCFKNGRFQYFTDTYDEIEFDIEQVSGHYFADNATATLRVGKFIDRLVTPETKESKFIRFILDDNSEVVLDFSKGRITKKTGEDEREYTFRYPINGNEYVNLLNHFYEAIVNQKTPRTGFGNSLLTLRTILESYQLPNGNNIRGGIYRQDEQTDPKPA